VEIMPGDAIISISGLTKTFASSHGPVHAIKNINLDVTKNEFVVLLGPSGCGKTTTLRCVAGLERPDAGSIAIGGHVANSTRSGHFIPPESRDIGMVFQSYAVWPHLNVYQNVALPLTDGRKRVPRNQIRDRVMESLRIVRMEGLENRPATDLSGGQQQRVALARAIVTRPMVLLMDEPLSNLDARLRDEMRLELKKIARSIDVTTLYVTHDQAEALSLGDKICVMNEGEILQVGSPEDVYSRPPNKFVAEFVGEMNFIKGRVTGPGEVDSPLGVRSYDLPPTCQVGSVVTLAIRPEHLGLCEDLSRSSHAVEGIIISKTFLGDAALFELELSGLTLQIKLPGDSHFTVGQRANIVLPADKWHIYA
jgi:iron(III) transport system ATP-binding protein